MSILTAVVFCIYFVILGVNGRFFQIKISTQVERSYVSEEPSGVILDWRQKGAVSPVSNQGSMGSSLVYSKRESVESMYAIKYHKLIRLSTNQTADCCNDGKANFDCIQNKLHGLCTAEEYGNARGHCDTTVNCTRYGQIAKTQTVTHNDENAMVKALHNGPLLANISAGVTSFEMYTGGIYADKSCNGQPLDHEVQIVGYGNQGGDKPYWIIKNSWGSAWGDKGYILLQRGTNMCGVSSIVFYPVPT